jgi:hypothetical protein
MILLQAISFLESDELEQEINDMCNKARDMGIKGVPLTIIDGKWAISGGQSSDVFVQVSLSTCLALNYLIFPIDIPEACCCWCLRRAFPTLSSCHGDGHMCLILLTSVLSLIGVYSRLR